MHSSATAAFATAESLLGGIEDDPTFHPRFIFHVDSSAPVALHAEVERWVIAHSAVAAAVPQPLDVEYMTITQAIIYCNCIRPGKHPCGQGIQGTEVVKGASCMILADDNI